MHYAIKYGHPNDVRVLRAPFLCRSLGSYADHHMPVQKRLGANIISQLAGVQMTGRDARRRIWQMRADDLTTGLQRRLGER